MEIISAKSMKDRQALENISSTITNISATLSLIIDRSTERTTTKEEVIAQLKELNNYIDEIRI